MNERAKQHLRAAIKTMRDFMDEAERELDQPGSPIYGTDLDKCNKVMHCLCWGVANASASVETAIKQVDREWQIEDAQRGK